MAIVRARYNPYGGAERFVQRALAALAGRVATLGSGGPEPELELTVIARRWDAGRGDGEAVVPVRLLRVDPFYLGSAWRDWSFARGVRRLLARERFDLVQSHERIPGVALYRAGDGVHAEFLAQRARVLPAWRRAWLRASLHHRWVLRAERRMFTDPALRAVICNAEMVRDEIERHFGVPRERLHLIRNGVDAGRFAPADAAGRTAARAQWGVPDDAAVFAFVGSGFERKGLAVAIRALARLPAGAWLLVAGADRRRAAYEAIARRAGVAGRVQFLGPVADVRPVLHAADAFVQPALYDPLPNAALEALACGLPVITSTASGAAELIAPGRNGFVTDSLDVESVAAAMAALAQPGAAGAMRKAARAAVEPLSPERMARELIELYAKLAPH